MRYLSKAKNKESINVNDSKVKFTTKVGNMQSEKASSSEGKKIKSLPSRKCNKRTTHFLFRCHCNLWRTPWDKTLRITKDETIKWIREDDDSKYFKYHRLVGHPTKNASSSRIKLRFNSRRKYWTWIWKIEFKSSQYCIWLTQSGDDLQYILRKWAKRPPKH